MPENCTRTICEVDTLAVRVEKLENENRRLRERIRDLEAVRGGGRSADTAAEAERIYRTLAESARDMIYIIGRDMRVQYVNNFAAKVFGGTPEEIIGRTQEELFSPLVASRHKTELQKVFDTGEAIFKFNVTDRFLISGQETWIDAKLIPLRDDAGEVTAVLGISSDITERKRMEAEMLRSSKLESLGVLAGGIAHDFNNVLMGIIGNIALAKKRLSPGERTHEILVRAEKTAYKARNLTEQLITFSRGGSPIKKVLAINDLVRDSIQFALTGSGVTPVFDIPETLLFCEIDDGQFSQVVTNLAINSKQAMPGGGRLEVALSSENLGQKSGEQINSGRYLKLVFRDFGSGIPAEIIDKIFDPYFTTKPDGNGLGLSTAYSIVKSHNGIITVASPPDGGTVFTIFLPAAAEPHERSAVLERELRDGRGKRVLLMDDDESVLLPMCEILSELGYDIRIAVNGSEAVDAYGKAMLTGKPFDAVIIDLVIKGGMGGRETIRKLRELDPSVCAIVSSGYSNDPVMSKFSEYGFMGVLMKPYDIAEVSSVLHRAIAEKRVDSMSMPAGE